MENLIVLALAAAFYPTLLAVVILILTRPQPVKLLAAFLIGGMVTSITVGFIVLQLIDSSGAVGGSDHNVSPAIDLIVGLLSLGIAFAVATGRDKPLVERRAARKAAKQADRDPADARDPWTTRVLTRDSAKLALALGVVLDLPSVWYLAALKDIAEADHSTGTELVQILIFNLIMFALIEIPLVCYLLFPERAAAAVARFDAWTRSHMRQIGATVAAVVGVYLVANGLAGLL